jgi:tRNA nucleotidyltransferase (CCA-adding enzyme)
MEIAAVLRIGFALAADPELDLDEASRARALFRRTLRVAFRDPVSVADLAIGGDELRAAGVKPGPGMRRVLEHLLDAVVEDPSRNTVGTLLAMAAAIDPQAPDDGRATPERPA